VSTAEDWTEVVPALATQRRVMAYDRRGGTAAGTPRTTAWRQAEVLASLCDALRLGPIACVGHAFGGSICLTFALSHPERVSRLVLVGTNGLPFPLPLSWRIVRASPSAAGDALAGALFGWPPLGRRLVRNRYTVAVARGRPVPAEWVDREFRSLRANGLGPLFAEIRQWDERALAARLEQIRTPTLVLKGAEDRYYMAPHWISAEIARRLPHGRLVEVAGGATSSARGACAACRGGRRLSREPGSAPGRCSSPLTPHGPVRRTPPPATTCGKEYRAKDGA
jgi:pimeloyl-ACP methyl ester carboxylesterase